MIGIGIEFIKAGRAVFTIENETGQHYTFKVKKDKSAPPLNPKFFVELRTSSDYTYLGMMFSNYKVVPTKASKLDRTSIPMRAFNFAIRCILGKQELPHGYKIRHEGKCAACGRELTEPESLTTGFGPVCRAKHLG